MDLYLDYLIASTSLTTATGLAKVTNNLVSHDKITRFLSSKIDTSAELWKFGKSYCREIEDENGTLSLDDSIVHKPYTDENEIVAWHHDHSQGTAVKGIGFISAVYVTDKGNLPVGYEVIEKTEIYIDKKTGKEKRKSKKTKNERFQDLIKHAIENQVKFANITADTWFSSSENMMFIHHEAKKTFVIPLKSNRLIALIENGKISENYVGIDSVKPGENKLVRLKDVDFTLRLYRQVLKNEDGVTVILDLVSNDLELTNEQIAKIYHKRWTIEIYHESLKNNVSLEKSPTKTVQTQSNHIFASLCGYIRLERISNQSKINHFALKSQIYIQALKIAFKELTRLSFVSNLQSENLAQATA